MKNKDIERFEESVKHYRRILNLVPNESPTSDQCSLCQHYYKNDCTNEIGDLCPIAMRTNEVSCQGTPWPAAYRAYYRKTKDGRNWYTNEEDDAIELELKWLKSFLPTLRMIPYV